MMTTKNFSTTIKVHATPHEAFNRIADVNNWWAKNFSGSASADGDTFKVTFGTTTVDFKISQVVPDRKIVWQVTDCHLPWLKNIKEWKGTEVVWEVSPQGDETVINMTHEGLTPDVECFEACKAGWTEHVNSSLLSLIEKGSGSPQ